MNQKKRISLKVRTWLLWIALAGIVLAISTVLFLYAGAGPTNNKDFKGNRKVIIEKRNGLYRFYKDGQPFFVKGVSGYNNLEELVASGGNTVSCWDTSRIASTLEEAAKYNVAVIIGLDIPGGENINYYKDDKNISGIIDAYSRIVRQYKDHPSLLAWSLGNELEMPFSFKVTPFYNTYNRLLNMMHTTDPHHPVSTTVINVAKKRLLNIQWRIPALDFIGINVYNSIKILKRDLGLIKMFWNGPYLITEWAPDGGWEAEVTAWKAPIENTSTKKAEQYYDFYTKYMPVKEPRFLGSMAFYWGSRQEYTHTWYSIFNEDGVPTEIKEVLNDSWKGKPSEHKAPRVRYMLVDSLGARANIVVNAGSEHRASLLLPGDRPADSLRYSWQITREDWLTWGRTWSNFKKPEVQYGLFSDSSLQYTRFTAPLKEGPYRVYVTVYNSKGYCATANTPIYVVQ